MNLIHLMLVACCTAAQKTTQSTRSDKNTNTTITSITTLATTSILSLETEAVDANVTIETTSVATCEANSSCLVSSTEPNLKDTTTEANTTIATNTTSEKHERIDVSLASKELCTCDLKLDICDVNCCCDQDCSLKDKSIFHHCESQNLYYDTRYCDYIQHIYVNNTPFQWHVNQNGLFCVLKSNLPPAYTIQRRQPLPSLEVAQQEKNNKFSWPRTLKKKEVKFNMSEGFIYGNCVWAVYMNVIKKFQVPKKLYTTTCLTKQDVLNLKDINNECVQTDISEDNKYLNFKNYFQNVSIVSNPRFLNVSKYKNIQECPRNICLAILPRICDKDFDNCENVSRNDSRLSVKCNFLLRNNKNDCKNVVKAVQYNFYHNGTQGYIKVEVLGVLEEVSYEFGSEDFEYIQEFKVNFWWPNQTKNFSAMLSGNPGYLIGKPVLSGNLVIVGNSTNAVEKIERRFDYYTENFLVLPENVNGHCILSKSKHVTVEFGHNLMTKCKFNTTAFNRKKYHNGTEICRELQKTILKMWGIIRANKTVGAFGNANANVPDEWIKIFYSLNFEKLLNRTTGRFSSGNAILSCFGLVRHVAVDVYHSRIDFKALLSQEKILGVTYTYEEFINKTLKYNKKENSTFLELDLESRVAFYDISVVKQKKFVDRPNLEIRLPYDFFYPFIKIENGAKSWTTCNTFHLILCLVVLFIK